MLNTNSDENSNLGKDGVGITDRPSLTSIVLLCNEAFETSEVREQNTTEIGTSTTDWEHVTPAGHNRLIVVEGIEETVYQKDFEDFATMHAEQYEESATPTIEDLHLKFEKITRHFLMAQLPFASINYCPEYPEIDSIRLSELIRSFEVQQFLNADDARNNFTAMESIRPIVDQYFALEVFQDQQWVHCQSVLFLYDDICICTAHLVPTLEEFQHMRITNGHVHTTVTTTSDEVVILPTANGDLLDLCLLRLVGAPIFPDIRFLVADDVAPPTGRDLMITYLPPPQGVHMPAVLCLQKVNTLFVFNDQCHRMFDENFAIRLGCDGIGNFGSCGSIVMRMNQGHLMIFGVVNAGVLATTGTYLGFTELHHQHLTALSEGMEETSTYFYESAQTTLHLEQLEQHPTCYKLLERTLE